MLVKVGRRGPLIATDGPLGSTSPNDAANIVSWVIVDAVFYLLSRWFDNLDFTRHDGSIAEVYLMLIATTPLTGRMLLWVLAPSATLGQVAATT